MASSNRSIDLLRVLGVALVASSLVSCSSESIPTQSSDAVEVRFTTAEDLAPRAHLEDRIQQLVADGVLTPGQGRALTHPLRNAERLAAAGRTRPAIALVKAVVRQIRAFVRSRRLTPSQGEELVRLAEAYIAELESVPPAADRVILLVTDLWRDELVFVDPRSRAEVARVPVGSSPWEIGISRADRAYITNNDTDDVTVIDVASFGVVSTVAVGEGPTGIAVSDRLSKAYVAHAHDPGVAVIDLSSHQATQAIALTRRPDRVAFSPRGNVAYVTHRERDPNSGITVIDPVTNEVLRFIELAGAGPRDIVFAPDGSEAYTVNQFRPDLSIIDVEGSRETGRIALPVSEGSPAALAISADGTSLYTVHAHANLMTVIDLSTRSVARTIPVAGGPFDIALNPDGRTAYVLLAEVEEIAIVDLASDDVVATIPGHPNANSLAAVAVP